MDSDHEGQPPSSDPEVVENWDDNLSDAESFAGEEEAGPQLRATDSENDDIDLSDLEEDPLPDALAATASDESESLQTKYANHLDVARCRKIKKLLHDDDRKKLMESLRRTNGLLLRSIQYHDINNLLPADGKFLVDADSLLIFALCDEGWGGRQHGQMLHLVYICERVIHTFTRIGGVAELVFFRSWESVWADEFLTLARTTLMAHFRYNTGYAVHVVENAWGATFQSLLQLTKPNFLLQYLEFSESDAVPNCCRHLARAVAQVSLNFVADSKVDCVDVSGISLSVSTVNAHVIKSRDVPRKVLADGAKFLDKVLRENALRAADEVEIPSSLGDVRRDAYVSAAAVVVTAKRNEEHQNLVRALLLKCALMESLPLKSRACPKVEVGSDLVREFASLVLRYLNGALDKILKRDRETALFARVADMWQENFFYKLLTILSEAAITGPSDLGNETADAYLSLVSSVNSLCKGHLDPFPVNISKLTEDSATVTGEKCKAVRRVERQFKQTSNLANLLPSSSQLMAEFCGESVLKNCWNTEQLAKLRPLVCRNRDFKEIYHWHSSKMILDDTKVATNHHNLSKRELTTKHKQRANYAYFMQFYSNNLEGNKIVSEPIVRDLYRRRLPAKPRKEKKLSNKAATIRNEVERRKQQEILKEEYKKLKILRSNLKVDANADVDSSIDRVKTFLKTVVSDDVKHEAGMLAADLYFKFLKFNFKRGERSRYDKYFVDFFLLLKELFLNCKKRIIGCSGHDVSSLGRPEMAEDNKSGKRKEARQSCKGQEEEEEIEIFKDLNKIFSYFHSLNLGKIAEKCKEDVISSGHLTEEVVRMVDEPVSSPDVFDTGFPWAQFQLNYLGPHLDRESSGVFDEELGFTPDGWQAELIAAIRKRQSVIVVAPTSSGKTYASYYCMKSVLKESFDGVVVYVSPTKALVNQVAATVYARFKDTNMANGVSLLGVFTRDYRYNSDSCQILVTVPECLEILLLSPRRTRWVRKVRFVIFDEIHCLSGIAGGISWESGLLLSRCPFLALSATVERPEVLERWLREASEYKKVRDSLDGSVGDRNYDVKLIVYTERHNDLEKHIFTDGQLDHVHPYTFLERETLLQHEGVPRTLSLSPKETLQLYLAMKAVTRNAAATDLVPEIYFASSSSSGFITKQQARRYESALSEKLYALARTSPATFDLVLEILSPRKRARIRGDLSGDELADLVETLEMKGMLPAIVFSYNRPLVQRMFAELTRHYTSKRESSEEECGLGKVAAKVKTVRKGKEVFLRNRKEIPSLRLLSGKSSIRSVGVADGDDVSYIERRLRKDGLHGGSFFVRGLRSGIGVHHGGLSANKRVAVEMLFRMKLLNVLFATGTLALGIHVPCRTVVVAGETRWLNVLNYHQMAGRAGRRGFDAVGNLVFWEVPRKKISHLMTAKLPVMLGNIPMTVSLILRLLLLVSKGVYGAEQGDEERKWNVSRALAFLNCNLVYQHLPELKQQMKHYFAFSNQLLMVQQLLDDDGNPQSLAGIVTHLHYHEPGNLVFVYLLRRGIFNKICKVERNGKISKQTELDLILVLSHLFTSLRLHKHQLRQTYKNSRVILDDMPKFVIQEIENYNKEVLLIFDNYFRCVAKECQEQFGEDNSLPLSGVSFAPRKSDYAYSNFEEKLSDGLEDRVICSSFAALSGHVDVGLYSPESLISTIRHQVFTDMKILPNFNLKQKLNGYAWDFYNHGVKKAIVVDNNLKEGDDFKMLKDFTLVLKALHASLSEAEEFAENETVVKVFGVVSENFANLFNKAYGIRQF